MTSLMTTSSSLPTAAVGAVAAWARSPRGQRALRGAVSIAAAIATEVARDPRARARLGALAGAVPARAAQPPTSATAWDVTGDVRGRGRGDVPVRQWADRPAHGDCAGWQAHRRARG